MNQDTYKVKLSCPSCGTDLSFQKKKNGVSIHQTRIRKLYRHMNDGTCTINSEKNRLAEVERLEAALRQLEEDNRK